MQASNGLGQPITCPEFEDAARFATAGRALPGYESRIAALETDAGLPAGEIGEILARGPMVMRGDQHRPAEMAETIDAEGWRHTGDSRRSRRRRDGWWWRAAGCAT